MAASLARDTRMDNKNESLYQNALHALRQKRWPDLRFEPASLEHAFRQEYASWRLQTTFSAACVALLFLLGGLFFEWVWAIEVHPIPFWGRVIAVIGILLTVRHMARERRSSSVSSLILLNGIVCTLVVLAFAFLSQPPTKQVYYGTLFFVQVFLFIYLRLPLHLSAFCGAFMFLTASAVLLFDSMTGLERAMTGAMLFLGTVLSLAVCVRMEWRERSYFLKDHLAQRELERLRQTNRDLAEQLACDSLTELPNRIALEEILQALIERDLSADHLSRRAAETSEESSEEKGRAFLVPVVIEDFKDLNERYGHQAGDNLLRAVARTLLASLTNPGEIASRVSGGKFVMLWFCDDIRDAERRLARARGLLRSVRALRENQEREQNLQISLCIWTPASSIKGSAQEKASAYVDDALRRCHCKHFKIADIA
ncbi:hypothetical protein HDN1F_12970 [gamma proteobacterium HdN1]|nr:hypothetical protein HDN1F_12970 [gamma proteobacterium HdN1]